MELKARYLKRVKAQKISRFEFQTQRKLCQERGSFQREPMQGGCQWEAQRSSIAMKWGITLKIAPKPNRGMGILK
jgi:hypothetical protein